MFNPYFEPAAQATNSPQSAASSSSILDKFKSLDKDDLLMLALIFVLVKSNSKEDIWPLVAVMLYCILGN